MELQAKKGISAYVTVFSSLRILFVHVTKSSLKLSICFFNPSEFIHHNIFIYIVLYVLRNVEFQEA
jgi:hypothetical protein